MSSNDSSVTISPQGNPDPPLPQGMSLLWVPYVALTVVLLLLTFASFMNYHFKNKEKYRNEKIKKEVQGLSMDEAVLKDPVLARAYENHQRQSLLMAKEPKRRSSNAIGSAIKASPAHGSARIQEQNPKEKKNLEKQKFSYSNEAFSMSTHSLCNQIQEHTVAKESHQIQNNGHLSVPNQNGGPDTTTRVHVPGDGGGRGRPQQSTSHPQPSTGSGPKPELKRKDSESGGRILSVKPLAGLGNQQNQESRDTSKTGTDVIVTVDTPNNGASPFA